MPRPVGTADEVTNDAVEEILEGAPVNEYSEELTKKDLKQLSEKQGEEVEEELLDAGIEVIENLDVDVTGNPDLKIVTSSEDIQHVEEDLNTYQLAAYLDDHDEVLMFTDTKPGKAITGCDPVGSIAHELKHRDQHIKYEKDSSKLYPLSEAITQLFNIYREGKIEDESLRNEEAVSLATSNYPRPERLAEVTKEAGNWYGELRSYGFSKDEAMSFMLNRYEEQRVRDKV